MNVRMPDDLIRTWVTAVRMTSEQDSPAAKLMDELERALAAEREKERDTLRMVLRMLGRDIPEEMWPHAKPSNLLQEIVAIVGHMEERAHSAGYKKGAASVVKFIRSDLPGIIETVKTDARTAACERIAAALIEKRDSIGNASRGTRRSGLEEAAAIARAMKDHG